MRFGKGLDNIVCLVTPFVYLRLVQLFEGIFIRIMREHFP